MRLVSSWPALQIGPEPLPPFIEYERGVWGKVHGAPTDFRWIARSGDFGRDCLRLQMQLSLGGEDAPARFVAWRTLGDRCYAVAGYPSRAMDASGRRGFLEKQVLEWRRPPGVPAAIGALLLLPKAARLTDDIWWDRYSGDLWSQPDLFLSLGAADHEPLGLDEGAIGIAVERGRQQLREALPEHALGRLYEQLLTGQKPSLLSGLQQPLPAEAVAALLLPLPRDVADQISVAGWVPAQRPALDDLGSRWDALVTRSGEPLTPSGSESARRLADALLATEPIISSGSADERRSESSVADAPAPPAPAVPLRPGLRMKLPEPPRDGAPILEELYAFADDANRRWLAPEALKGISRTPKPDAGAARLIASWIAELERQKPRYAHDEQWSVKIDLLRSAAIVLIPDPETVRAIGLPSAQSRVPALLYGLSFESPRQWDTLAALQERALRETLTQSAGCAAPATLWEPLRRSLAQWRAETRRHDVNVRGLVGDALASHPHP